MKVVFVAGFFRQVRDKLKDEFTDQLISRSIIWIRQAGTDGGVNINEFRKNFNDRLAAGATEVLVLLAELSGKDYVITNIEGVVQAGQHKWPGANVKVEQVRNAGATDFVVERISEFALPTVPLGPEVAMQLLHTKLAGGRVLCIRETNHTSFERAFERAGFPAEAWNTIFKEEAVGYGKLSNLIAWMQSKSKSYCCLVYAWHGLKYIGDKEKLKCPLYQAGNVKDAIDRFKTWILGQT